MRIAFFSPLPPDKTGVAFHSGNLLPELSQLAQITVFSQNFASVEAALSERCTIRDLESFRGPLREGFDICLYQMGNNLDFHEGIYRTLRRYPGITILHDLNIHSFFGELYNRGGHPAAYVREIAYAYGPQGARRARLAQQGLIRYDVQRYPMFERLVDLSLGTIVHSKFARDFISSRRKTAAVVHINQPLPIPNEQPTKDSAKISLGLDPGDLLLASFGIVAPVKRVEVTLRAFAQLRKIYPQLRYALVGSLATGYSIDSLLGELGLTGKVDLVGFANEATYQAYLAATDIGLNLRYPTSGETSRALLEQMAAGKPVLVSDVDAFAELPSSACIKVGVGNGESTQVEVLLKALIEDQALRREIGENAKTFIRQNCDPAMIAGEYIDFIKAILGRAMRLPVLDSD